MPDNTSDHTGNSISYQQIALKLRSLNVEEIHGGNVYSRKIEYDFSVNINPLGCNETVYKAMEDAVRSVENYPEYRAVSLRKKLADALNVNEDDLVITSGASEAFTAICRAEKFSGGIVIDPCFYGYEYALDSVGADIIRLDKTDALLDMESFADTAVFLANPNNPDGKLVNHEKLLSIAEYVTSCGGIVITDECFLPLTGKLGESLAERINGWNGLYVVRSFTKTFAIPGIRLGYVICSDMDKAIKLQKQLPEWNVSNIAIAAGIAALDHTEDVKKAAELINVEREFLFKSLMDVGLNVFPSDANYILFKGPEGLKEKLMDRKILIRDCSNYRNLGKGYFRVAVKDHRSNLKLMDELKNIINE